MSLEKARQREVHKYYQPWLESPTTFDSSQPTPSSRYHHDGTRLNASTDTALTAFAQLGCLRLDAKRGIVTLIDSARQYILAEATRTLSLISNDGAEATGDDIWFGNASIPRGQGVSHDALNPDELTAFDEDGSTFTARALVVDDMACHPVYKSREYTNNGVSFYCGVPIVTGAGHSIGVYTITDDKPRQGISATHLRFLTEMSQVVMHHLETSKNEVARYRGETLARGLGRFVQGHSSLDPRRDSSPKPLDRGQRGPSREHGGREPDPLPSPDLSRTFRGMEITTADPRTLRPVHVGEAVSARRDSGSHKPSRARSVQQMSLGARNTQLADDREKISTEPPSDPPSFPAATEGRGTFASEHTKAPRGVFVRAANILRHCAAADGVLFFDAASDRTAFNTLSRSSSTQTDLPSKSQTSEPSSSDDDPNDTADTRNRNCQLLGYSLDVSESSSSDSESLTRFKLTQRTLSRLVRHYPNGKLFFLNTTGISSSEDEEEVVAGVSLQQVGSSQTSDLLEGTGASGTTRKAVNRTVAKELLKAVPDARTVLWLPLWDFYNQRWAAGCFLWSRRRERLISAQDDLVYLKTFSNSVMAEHARIEAAKVDTAKTTFIANISHELRTPLHGILGSLDVLQATSLTELQSSLSTAIEVSAKTLADTLDHVLDYAKINQLTKNARRITRNSAEPGETQGTASYGDEFDLAAVVEEVVEAVCASYTFYAKRSNHIDRDLHRHASRNMNDVQVALEIQSRDSWAVWAQPGAIRRVLTNLLGNSMKYTDEGFVKIGLGQVKSTSQHQESVEVQLTVTDTGSGMSQDFIDHEAFVPFRQESSFSAGAGLGLSIVRQIVQSYNGHVNIQSQKGVGTEVTVKMALPVTPSPSLPMELCDTTSLVELQQKTRGMSMLLLKNEDGAASREIDLQQLTVFDRAIEGTSRDWLGMTTTWASLSGEAEADVHIFITAPTSIELADHIERRKGASKAPVIAVTATAVEQAQVLAQLTDTVQKFGIALDVISHPVGPRKLAMAVAKCLQLTNAAASNSDYNVTTGEAPLSLPIRRSSKGETFSLPASVEPVSSSQTEDSRIVELESSDNNRDNGSPVSLKQHQSPSASTNMPDSDKLRVLLVDDNAINIAILQQFMRRAKISFDVATDGLQALEAYKAARKDGNKHGFSHILMDISMPVMDGITSTHEIRLFEQEQKCEPCVIIALSGVAAEQTQNDILSAGASTFLAKPVKYKQLLEIIDPPT